jgi:hypothetical protein
MIHHTEVKAAPDVSTRLAFDRTRVAYDRTHDGLDQDSDLADHVRFSCWDIGTRARHAIAQKTVPRLSSLPTSLLAASDLDARNFGFDRWIIHP